MRGGVLFAVLTLWLSAYGAAVAGEFDGMHKEMLWPVVRVTTGSAGGSGTILYSADRGDGMQTYVLTNHHVIAAAIHVVSTWSSLLQRDVKREQNDEVKVEIFRYAEGSRQDITDSCSAEIVAHSAEHDLALLKLKTSRQFENVAAILPKDAVVEIFQPVWAVGCSLLHPTIATAGQLSYLDDVIDRKDYWMSNAQIIFGNSGGAVFTKSDDKYYFIGVPSRVAGTWGQAITHMGWFVPVTRIRQWCDDEHLTFLTDTAVKPGDCFKKREELRKRAEERRNSGLGVGSPNLAPGRGSPEEEEDEEFDQTNAPSAARQLLRI